MKGSKIVSTDPSDQMFLTETVPDALSPKSLTVITGNTDAANYYGSIGVKTISTPELKTAYQKASKQFEREVALYNLEKNRLLNQLSSETDAQKRFDLFLKSKTLKEPKIDKFNYFEDYNKLQNELIPNRPTIQNYNRLQENTGLNPGVSSDVSEKGRLIDAIDNQTIGDPPIHYSTDTKKMLTANKNELQRINYRNVFYDPAAPREYSLIKEYNDGLNKRKSIFGKAKMRPEIKDFDDASYHKFLS
jgi:hypothetical protein